MPPTNKHIIRKGLYSTFYFTLFLGILYKICALIQIDYHISFYNTLIIGFTCFVLYDNLTEIKQKNFNPKWNFYFIRMQCGAIILTAYILGIPYH